MSKESIETAVNQLNYGWFKRKKACFIKETFYVPSLEKIYEPIRQEKIIMEDGKEIDLSYDIEINIDLKKYCWNDYYPECASCNEYNTEVFPISSSTASLQVIAILENMISDIQDLTVIKKYILGSIRIVGETIKQLLLKNEDAEYEAALDYFNVNFQRDVATKFRHIHQSLNFVADYVDKLKFNLNQEELGALLYILYRAEMFDTPTPTDTSFVNFCIEHFHFDNQVAKTHTKATKLRDKFNEAKKPICPARDRVKNQLIATLKEL